MCATQKQGFLSVLFTLNPLRLAISRHSVGFVNYE
jgi:hypothetical protein